MKNKKNIPELEFYSENEYEVLNHFESSKDGLKEEEIHRRIRMYGKNRLQKKKFKGLIIFFRQFKSPLIWILLLTVIISLSLGEIINSVIILVIILMSSLLSFFDEYRSEKIVDVLNQKIAHKTIVTRNGKKMEVAFSELVPGDIVHLYLGSIVPADLRIIESKNLEINESAFTGESIPVEKNSLVIKEKITRIQDFKNYAFAGSTVTYGAAVGVVIFTGKNTEMGKISMDSTNERPETEFQKGITNFGGLLFKVILGLTIAIFFFNSFFRHDWLSSLMFAIAIAVGIAPELLPAILSVSLSKGARSMAKKEVVVKRLISIEDFGNMDVLCTDKTGTLTEGNLSLYKSITIDNKNNDKALLYGLLCNSTIVHGKKLIGNPIDVAIWKNSSERFSDELNSYKIVDEIAFDYERKRMSVAVNNSESSILISKGAPKSIVSICKRVYFNGKELSINFYSKNIEEKYYELSNQGYRVIAISYKVVDKKKSYSVDDENGMVFLGFLTFIDPPKKSAKKSIDRLESLNIKFKILTGDNEIVTKKVAEEINIKITKIVLSEEIDRLKDDELRIVVEEANAFCRLTPNQKLRIIKALKANGHEVGYIGDGVNDVMALHEADVGISVNDALEVAKDASDIVLMKKSLSSLADGVIEGRKVFNNTMKYILLSSSSNFGNMFSAAGASLFLPFLPMLPMQILLLNFLSDFSQFTLSSDEVDEENLKKPKRWRIDILKKYMFIFGSISSFYDYMTYFVMLVVFKASQAMFQTGWFIESMMTEIFVIFSIRTKRFPFFLSKPGKLLVISTIVIAIATIMIPYSPIAGLLGFEKLPPLYFGVLFLMVIGYIVMVEIAKKWFFSKYEL